MGKPDNESLFKPPLSRMESKARATDEAFRAITEEEIAKRDRKTARLREIRLAREAEEGQKEPTKARRKARSRNSRAV